MPKIRIIGGNNDERDSKRPAKTINLVQDSKDGMCPAKLWQVDISQTEPLTEPEYYNYSDTERGIVAGETVKYPVGSEVVKVEITLEFKQKINGVIKPKFKTVEIPVDFTTPQGKPSKRFFFSKELGFDHPDIAEIVEPATEDVESLFDEPDNTLDTDSIADLFDTETPTINNELTPQDPVEAMKLAEQLHSCVGSLLKFNTRIDEYKGTKYDKISYSSVTLMRKNK